MIYGSRGTQTERDTILANSAIAAKAVVFVERCVREAVLTKGVASESWKRMEQCAQVVEYEREDLPEAILKRALALTEDIRRACYVRDLRLGVIT